MRYLQEAFNQACATAKQPEGFYVCLMEETSRYGGPEEGGWYINDNILTSYQWCGTEEEAEAMHTAILELAKELEKESQRAFGELCSRELEWLEARGLDADWLPEPDGPSHFSVIKCKGVPSNHYGPRSYS